MGNKHGKWSPEGASRGWTRHREERYVQLSSHGSRPRARTVSRWASRRFAVMATIEEEWQILYDLSTHNSQEKTLVLQDNESHPVAQTCPKAGLVPDVAQPGALMDQSPKEVQVTMKRIHKATLDQQEQQYAVTSFFVEDPVSPYGGGPRKQNSSTEERVSYHFYNGAGNGNPEEAKVEKALVWNVDDLTPETETMVGQEDCPFEQKGKTSKEEILVPAEHGTQDFYCDNNALQSRDAKRDRLLSRDTPRTPAV